MRLSAGSPGFTTVALFARFCILPYLSISLRALSSYCREERATANGPEGRPFLQEDVPHPPFHSAGSFFNNLDRCSNIGDSSQRGEESCFSLGPGDSWYLFVGRIASYKLLPPHCCHASAILRLCYRPCLLPRPGSIIATLQLYYCHACCYTTLHSHLCCHRLHSITAANLLQPSIQPSLFSMLALTVWCHDDTL